MLYRAFGFVDGQGREISQMRTFGFGGLLSRYCMFELGKLDETASPGKVSASFIFDSTWSRSDIRT